MTQQKVLALACVLLVSGCATVVRGTTEDVVIRYSPDDARVTTSNNHTCSSSPCVIKVPRKESFVVTTTKPGYQKQSVAVGTKVTGKGAAGIAGNVIVGGVIGVGVDAATGAGRDHFPNPVIIDLVKEGEAAPQLRPAKPAGKRKKSSPTS